MNPPLRLAGRVSSIAADLSVRRLLPDLHCRSVGPFVFFDHFGPVTLAPETDSDVGPHPHIGLATVTYLLEGESVHRDSLGTVQALRPGEINWMTAGRGIVHSERATEAERNRARRAHGLQLWVALPPALEQTDPAFQHVPANELPALALPGGVQLRVLVGEALGAHSPVRTASPTLYLDLHLPRNTRWQAPVLAEQIALYSPEHAFLFNGDSVPATEMLVIDKAGPFELMAGDQGARILIIGGAPLEQPVRMWWNFVSVERDRLGEAAARWARGDFPTIPGESTRIAAPPWKDQP